MGSIAKSISKQKAGENDISWECAGDTYIPQPIGEKHSCPKFNKNGSGDSQDRDITKTMLNRIRKHWQALGWVDVSSSPVGSVVVWRNYR